jgi:hypothetical protein
MSPSYLSILYTPEGRVLLFDGTRYVDREAAWLDALALQISQDASR